MTGIQDEPSAIRSGRTTAPDPAMTDLVACATSVPRGSIVTAGTVAYWPGDTDPAEAWRVSPGAPDGS
jgi:hypothetical protein